MTNTVSIQHLKSLGYYVREGAYQGTADDCLGRYYGGHDDQPYAPIGPGCATTREAWGKNLEIAHLRGDI
jgi:hypothetical protein